MEDNVKKPIQNLSAVDGLSISQMEQDWTDRTIHYNGYNYTSFPLQEGFEPYDWFRIARLFVVEKNQLVVDSNSYTRKQYDPMTADIRDVLNNPTVEWGVEVKWR